MDAPVSDRAMRATLALPSGMARAVQELPPFEEVSTGAATFHTTATRSEPSPDTATSMNTLVGPGAAAQEAPESTEVHTLPATFQSPHESHAIMREPSAETETRLQLRAASPLRCAHEAP
jgi:hypothetical protein